MHRYTACIFDLDGTLTRPGLIDFAGIKRLIGCPQQETLIEFLAGVHGREARQAWRIIDDFERAAVARAQANPDVHRVLGALRERGTLCFVLTRNSRRAAAATLRHLFLRAYITDMICREDATPKPHPEGVLRLIRRWRLDTARTLMVGDFRFDVLTGAAAGTATAFLTNRAPLVNGAAFPAGHPTHVIPDLAALLRIV